MDDQLGKFLLAEHRYFADSFWKNEELGEKRVTFFITLVTAVMAAVVALATAKAKDQLSLDMRNFYVLAVYALFALLLFGIVTLQRMIRRNLVTDQYKRAQDTIREYFRMEYKAELGNYHPFDTTEKRKIGTGGLVETVAVINSLIVASLCSLFVASTKTWVIGLFGLVGFLSSWGVHRRYITSRYTQ